MAALMMRYADYKGFAYEMPADGYALNAPVFAEFPDAPPNWAREYLAFAIYNGLITGVASGGESLIRGNGATPRAQAGTVVMRFINELVTTCDRGSLEEWYITWIGHRWVSIG